MSVKSILFVAFCLSMLNAVVSQGNASNPFAQLTKLQSDILSVIFGTPKQPPCCPNIPRLLNASSVAACTKSQGGLFNILGPLNPFGAQSPFNLTALLNPLGRTGGIWGSLGGLFGLGQSPSGGFLAPQTANTDRSCVFECAFRQQGFLTPQNTSNFNAILTQLYALLPTLGAWYNPYINTYNYCRKYYTATNPSSVACKSGAQEYVRCYYQMMIDQCPTESRSTTPECAAKFAAIHQQLAAAA